MSLGHFSQIPCSTGPSKGFWAGNLLGVHGAGTSPADTRVCVPAVGVRDCCVLDPPDSGGSPGCPALSTPRGTVGRSIESSSHFTEQNRPNLGDLSKKNFRYVLWETESRLLSIQVKRLFACPSILLSASTEASGFSFCICVCV